MIHIYNYIGIIIIYTRYIDHLYRPHLPLKASQWLGLLGEQGREATMSFPNSVDPGTVRDGVRDAQVFISGEEPYRSGRFEAPNRAGRR